MISEPIPLGTRCLARDAFGWDRNDPDLREFSGDEPVVLKMVPTAMYERNSWVDEYMCVYRSGGPGAMPPLWAYRLGDEFPSLITGNHRSSAAFLLGWSELPAWIVEEES